MRTLSALVRSEPILFDNARFKKCGANMQARKERRRQKGINIYSREYTGEQSENIWFNAKKFRAMGHFFEARRNTHIGTKPIAPDLKKEIVAKFTQDSHWAYYNFRNHNGQKLLMRETINKCVSEAEVAQLPASIRKFLSSQMPLEEEKIPNSINPEFIYTQQLNIILPQDERHRFNLQLKMANPPEDQNASKEDEMDESSFNVDDMPFMPNNEL